MQKHIPCLLIIVPWDDYLTNIASLFMEFYIAVLGDTIDGIHLLLVEDDPYPVGAREQTLGLNNLHLNIVLSLI